MSSFLGKYLQSPPDSETSTSGTRETHISLLFPAKWALNKKKISWKIISDSPKNLRLYVRFLR